MTDEEKEAAAACKELSAPYIRMDWWRGGGIGAMNGKPTIEIRVKSKENIKTFPEEYKGFVVNVRAIGDIVAL